MGLILTIVILGVLIKVALWIWDRVEPVMDEKREREEQAAADARRREQEAARRREQARQEQEKRETLRREQEEDARGLLQGFAYNGYVAPWARDDAVATLKGAGRSDGESFVAKTLAELNLTVDEKMEHYRIPESIEVRSIRCILAFKSLKLLESLGVDEEARRRWYLDSMPGSDENEAQLKVFAATQLTENEIGMFEFYGEDENAEKAAGEVRREVLAQAKQEEEEQQTLEENKAKASEAVINLIYAFSNNGHMPQWLYDDMKRVLVGSGHDEDFAELSLKLACGKFELSIDDTMVRYLPPKINDERAEHYVRLNCHKAMQEMDFTDEEMVRWYMRAYPGMTEASAKQKIAADKALIEQNPEMLRLF